MNKKESKNKTPGPAPEPTESDPAVRILLVGRTGVGKSATVNSLLGEEVAPVEAYESGPADVRQYQYTKNGVPYIVFDTPGLCDELPDDGRDDEYLRSIAKAVSSIDVVWYVTRLDDERVRSDEKHGIRAISQTFGAAIWDHALVVLTGADRVSPAAFEEAVRQRSALLHSEIERRGYPGCRVPFVPVSNAEPALPSGKEWLPELFTQTFTRLRSTAEVPFLLSMKGDVSADDAPRRRIHLDERQTETLRRKAVERFVAAASTGAAVGYRVGRRHGNVPAIIGAGTGAAAGVLLAGFLE